jgi:hypothetical protein
MLDREFVASSYQESQGENRIFLGFMAGFGGKEF